MKKKIFNILFIIGSLLNLMPIIYSLKKLVHYIPFLQKYGIDMPGETFELTVCFGVIFTIALFCMFCFTFVLFKINRVELTYTKEEIAAKVKEMRKAREERKEATKRNKTEQKKKDLQKQLDELNEKDGE